MIVLQALVSEDHYFVAFANTAIFAGDGTKVQAVNNHFVIMVWCVWLVPKTAVLQKNASIMGNLNILSRTQLSLSSKSFV